jgi:hypothetical protein
MDTHTLSPETQADTAQLDRLCSAYLIARRAEKVAKVEADELKSEITAIVQKHGVVPVNAERSVRLITQGYCATVTTGISTEIKDENVSTLKALMTEARCARIFPLLFDERSEYTLAKTANNVVAARDFPKKWKDRIINVYATCFSAKTKAPALDVESKSARVERERNATSKPAKNVADKGRA